MTFDRSYLFGFTVIVDKLLIVLCNILNPPLHICWNKLDLFLNNNNCFCSTQTLFVLRRLLTIDREPSVQFRCDGNSFSPSLFIYAIFHFQSDDDNFRMKFYYFFVSYQLIPLNSFPSYTFLYHYYFERDFFYQFESTIV